VKNGLGKRSLSRLQRIRRLISSDWYSVPRSWRGWFLLLTIIVLAAVLRLYALDRLRPGLYHDEAYNGLDALNVIRGQRPIFFEANNGREPLFIYLVALSVSLLGRSPLAIRLVAALLGILTVPVTYWMVRELLGRQEALLAALVTATTFWHLNLSRAGFRAVSLPLFTALWLGFLARGLRRQRRCDWALAGVFLGLSFYTYLAARFAPLILLGLVVYWLARRQSIPWRGLFLLGICACVVASPLLIYAFRHLDTFLERSAEVSIFNPDINQGNLVGAVLQQVLRTLGMFNWRGDFIPRHNLPYRPVFDLPMGLLFLLGLLICLSRARGQQEYALLLISWAVMLLPTVLAEGAPHFLRAVGVLPILFVFPAVGLKSVWHAVSNHSWRWVAAVALVLLIGFSLCMTVNDYFVRHVGSEAVYYNFETGAVDLAAEINHFLGTGWYPGTDLRVSSSLPLPQRHLFLDERLWRDWPNLRYLVPETAGLTLLGSATSLPASADEARVVVWPYADYFGYLSALPRNHLISVWEGPSERGDLEKEARLLCLTYEARPAGGVPCNVQENFEQGIELVGYEWGAASTGSLLRLFWRAGAELDKDYSVFVHLRRNNQTVAQSDSYPAAGYYPTHLWRPGDIVADDHPLTPAVALGEGYSLEVGLYLLSTLQRLQVLDVNLSEPKADAVIIVLP
jgi:4-amino-4-deoxy-L-arabinose transferase-like glycosyltransferase